MFHNTPRKCPRYRLMANRLMYRLGISRYLYIITNSYTYIEAFRGSFFAQVSRDISRYIGAVLCGVEEGGSSISRHFGI